MQNTKSGHQRKRLRQCLLWLRGWSRSVGPMNKQRSRGWPGPSNTLSLRHSLFGQAEAGVRGKIDRPQDTQDPRRHIKTKGKLLHCMRTASALHAYCTHRCRDTRPRLPPYHLFDSVAKQQSPQDNNQTAFKLVFQCLYEQTTQPCQVQLCRGMQDAHMFKWQVPHSNISPRPWPHN